MKRQIEAGFQGRARLAVLLVFSLAAALAHAADVQVFHADSPAGPMREVNKAFVAKWPGINVVLTSGVSRQLAERIIKGEIVDAFAPSSPAVIDEDLMNMPVAGSGSGTGKSAANWYVAFSANEMVIITAKGNPLGIKQPPVEPAIRKGAVPAEIP